MPGRQPPTSALTQSSALRRAFIDLSVRLRLSDHHRSQAAISEDASTLQPACAVATVRCVRPTRTARPPIATENSTEADESATSLRPPPAPALVAPARPAPSCSAPSCSAPRTEKPAPGRTRRRAVYQLVCEPKPASEPDRDPTATAWPTRHPDLNRTAPEGPPAGDLACGPGQAVRRPPDPTRSVSSQCLSAPLHRSTIRHRSSAVPLGTAFGVRSPAGHPQNASPLGPRPAAPRA